MATKRARPADELIELATVLLFIQGTVGIVATIEVGIVAAATGGLVLAPFLLTAAAAVLTLALTLGLRRRKRRTRPVAVFLQVLWLFAAAIDLLLAALLARRGLELVPTLTRIVVPLVVFRILRRPQVRAAFGARPSRRERRATRRAAADATPAGATSPSPVGVSP